MRKWRIEDSAELYNITGWGLKYFSINEKGHVTVTPKEGAAAVDLKELMDELQVRDVPAPILVRFPDILDNRIEKISNCFKQAATEYGYTAQNFIIYPIKVNQMSPVVEEIVSHGKKFNIGLEAGSKPELHAVLAINIDSNSLIICNGYKDENYIELALLAQKMGRRIFLVVEKLNELHLIATIAKRLKISPNIGIRIKLASSGSGKWEDSGGDVSKFGLNSSELLEALDILEKNKMKDCLKLIHFHIGSQVTKIRLIKNALREASQFYVQLYKMGYNIELVDIGGGLGVDYDGTRSSTSESSMNYSIQEYVNDSIWTLVDVCAKNDLPQPNIITESGRSLTAHHSVLIFEVLETTTLPEWDEDTEISENDHELVRELYNSWDNLNQPRLIETWHDALQIREEALDLFGLGDEGEADSGSASVPVPDVEEWYPPELAPEDIVAYISREKSQAVQAAADAIVITADTMVFLDDQRLGKPHDEAEALSMLTALSGRKHKVCTGVTVRQREKALTRTQSTDVYFREASRQELLAYIRGGEPMDKAGAYGVQGQGALLVERIDGDFFNVMGLPVLLLSRMLAEFGVTLL